MPRFTPDKYLEIENARARLRTFTEKCGQIYPRFPEEPEECNKQIEDGKKGSYRLVIQERLAREAIRPLYELQNKLEKLDGLLNARLLILERNKIPVSIVKIAQADLEKMEARQWDAIRQLRAEILYYRKERAGLLLKVDKVKPKEKKYNDYKI